MNKVKGLIEKVLASKDKFIAGAELAAVFMLATPNLAAEQNQKVDVVNEINVADDFAMCVEQVLKSNASVYKFYKMSGKERQHLMMTNYDLWLKLDRQMNAVLNQCKEKLLSAKLAGNRLTESDIEQLGYICNDLMCDKCSNVECLIDNGKSCVIKCEDILAKVAEESGGDLSVFLEKTKNVKNKAIQNLRGSQGR